MPAGDAEKLAALVLYLADVDKAILVSNGQNGLRFYKENFQKEKCLWKLDEIVGHDVVINKGPDRDIDRDAINMLISFLLEGEYQVIVVDRLTDLTNDLSDLEELLKDAERVGVKVFELSTMQFRNHVYLEGTMDMDSLMDLIRMWS